MSGYEYKHVIRAEIKELQGKSKSEAYEYFKNTLGEANDVEIYDGEVDWFKYEEKEKHYVPVKCLYSDRWGVDYILKHDNDYYSDHIGNIPFIDIENIITEMASMFDITDYDVRIVSYAWYNGSDEPIDLR